VTLRSAALAFAVAALAMLALRGTAQARNPHCAGGIQYVVQGIKDKEKGNVEDYQREMGKAVQQLEQGTSEDPNDLEALGYLGWAYAEVDSAGPAGKAFAKAIDGLRQKGDPKKADWAMNNRESYWANAFNDGIGKINTAQTSYADFCKQPDNDADKTLRNEAAKKYDEAKTSLTRALLLKPGNAQTVRTLGSVYAFECDFATAEKVFRAGLETSPGDSSLLEGVKSVRGNYANQLLGDRKYTEAIAYYGDLVKGEPNNSDLHLGLADAYFKRAQDLKGDASKPDYKAAGDEYAKAAALKPTDADLPFNAALAYQNATEWQAAEGQWRATLKLRPDDVDAISALGSSLSELKSNDEALRVLQAGVLKNPKNKTLHRQLGAVYTKVGNNPKSTEELMVFLALDKGKPVDDPAARAKTAPAGSAAAKTLAANGPPDAIVPWEVDQNKIETWFYWSKNQAFHFQNGAAYGKSDWSSVDVKSAPATTGKK
jgi:tetratricopeptide (TPR) repeat protein